MSRVYSGGISMLILTSVTVLTVVAISLLRLSSVTVLAVVAIGIVILTSDGTC